MALKIALLLLIAGATWWLTRPQGRFRRRKATQRLTQCKSCGVYHEADAPCQCERNAGDKKS